MDDAEDDLKRDYLIDKQDREEDGKSSNQTELFETKLRSILFPEPIFSQYISELKTKPSKPVKFPNVEPVLKDEQAKQQQTLNKPQYTRYLRTWKKSIVHTDKLTSYLSNLRELHLAKLITFIEQMHKNSLYTDLDLYVDNLCFPVHKLILACYAPFIFQKLERNRAKQNPIEKLKLINIDAQSFAIIISFMYTGMAQPNENNFLPVLNAAIHLFMFDFANAWVELYEHKFANRTAQLLFRSTIARQYGWTDYTQMLNVALAFDFEHLLISDQFEDLPFEQLRDILQMDNIGVISEVVLYLAVLKWLNFDFDERKNYALDLMRLIRFANMDENELFACYNPPILPEVIEMTEIKAMMADAFNLLMQLKTIEDETVKQQHMRKNQRPRNYRLSNSCKDQPLELWCYLISKNNQQSSCFKKDKIAKLKDKTKDDQRTTSDADSQTSDTFSSQSDAYSKYKTTPASSTVTNYTSDTSIVSTSPDQALNDQRLKPEIQTDIEKLISNGQQEYKQNENKLAVLKTLEQKQRLSDTICRCKNVKHNNAEECKKERAAEIIQRTYRRFRELKDTKTPKQIDKKKRPKIKPRLFGKNTIDETSISDSHEDDDKSIDELIKDSKNKKNKKNKRNKRHKKVKSDDTSTKTNSNDTERLKLLNQPKRSRSSEPFTLTDLSKREPLLSDSEQGTSISGSKSIISTSPQFPSILTSVEKPKKETDDLAGIKRTQEVQTHRTDRLILYSDSINQEFCGFFVSQAGSKLNGQLISWKKKFQFNQTKNLNPPYDTVMVSHNQSVYLVGGMQMKSNKTFYVSKGIFKFQWNGKRIEQLSDLKIPRVQHSCVVAGDRLYVICGCKSLNVPVNTVECIHLMSSKSFRLKSELIKLPTYGRFGQSAVYFRSRLWIIGGIAKIDNNFHLLSEIWILDAQNTNKWFKSKFPVPIAFAGICTVNEEFIYVVGGRCAGLNGKLQPSEKVWCYSATTKRWQQIVSLNQPRCNCCCVLMDNKIYTFGGSLENDTEHLRGQTSEFYDLYNPNQSWKMLNKNLPCPISGQSVVKMSSF